MNRSKHYMSRWNNHEGVFEVQNGKPVHPAMSSSAGYSDLAYGEYQEDAGVKRGILPEIKRLGREVT
jgi:hypothetical protein